MAVGRGSKYLFFEINTHDPAGRNREYSQLRTWFEEWMKKDDNVQNSRKDMMRILASYRDWNDRGDDFAMLYCDDSVDDTQEEPTTHFKWR